jgi:integral membrane protein
LILVFVAMPLKYGFGLPLAVRVIGMLHGVFFLALLAVTFQVVLERSVSKGTLARVLGLSFLPFGFLLSDRMLRTSQGNEHANG